MSQPTPKSESQKNETDFKGYEEVTVEYLSGEKETVKVFRPSLDDIPRWRNIFAQALYHKHADLYAKREEGWEEELTDESREEILEVGNRLVVPTLARVDRLEKTYGPVVSVLAEQRKNNSAKTHGKSRKN